MNKWGTYYWAFVVLLISTLHFANKKPEIETVFSAEEMAEIHADVAERVAAFVQREQDICHQQIMEKVDEKVDSILMADIKKLLANDPTLADDTPPRPVPPTKPPLITPKDSTPLAPLVPDLDILEIDSLQ